MLGAIFTGLSGMTAYSRGLDLISNNVANLNTPGFKVSDPLFRELVYSHLDDGSGAEAGMHPSGAGVEVDSSRVSFRQGDLRDTGNALDVAIDGNGFFVLDKDGQQLFTRAGQFEFNKDGVLVERDSGAFVMLNTPALGMTSYNLNADRTFTPRTTAEVMLSGTLARGGTTSTYELPNIAIIDSGGASMTLRARFTRSTDDAKQWTVEILNSDNDVVGTGQLRFNEDGTPEAEYAAFDVSVTPEGKDAFTVKFNAGAAGTHAGITSIGDSTTSQLQMLKQDGVPIGSLSKTEYDDRGNLKLTYSNGETRTVGSLVLALFDTPEQLQSLGRSLYSAKEGSQPVFGSGLSSGLGRVMGGQIELSNVELTEQFTDLIIIQRGYQASSQVSSVANEMLQQLLAMDSHR